MSLVLSLLSLSLGVCLSHLGGSRTRCLWLTRRCLWLTRCCLSLRSRSLPLSLSDTLSLSLPHSSSLCLTHAPSDSFCAHICISVTHPLSLTGWLWCTLSFVSLSLSSFIHSLASPSHTSLSHTLSPPGSFLSHTSCSPLTRRSHIH